MPHIRGIGFGNAAKLPGKALLPSTMDFRGANLSASMEAFEHNLPVTIQQVLAWVRQCTAKEKQAIISELVHGTDALTLASEESLAKDWTGKEEDEAWKDL